MNLRCVRWPGWLDFGGVVRPSNGRGRDARVSAREVCERSEARSRGPPVAGAQYRQQARLSKRKCGWRLTAESAIRECPPGGQAGDAMAGVRRGRVEACLSTASVDNPSPTACHRKPFSVSAFSTEHAVPQNLRIAGHRQMRLGPSQLLGPGGAYRADKIGVRCGRGLAAATAVVSMKGSRWSVDQYEVGRSIGS